MHDQLKKDQFKFFFSTCKIIYDSAVRDKLLANDANVLDWVIPKLLAYRSVMVIRDIKLRKEHEKKTLRQKLEREGKGFSLEGNEDPRFMTEYELKCVAIDTRQREDPSWQKSEEQLIAMKADEERLIYGRQWIWEGYFNEKNCDQWVATAEALKNVNDHVLQDIEDFILLEAYKDKKPDQIRQIIENDHSMRIADQKKLLGKDSDEFWQKAQADIKKRKFMNDLRPPGYWNFFEDCKEEEKVPHVLRYNADPRKSY